MYACYVCYGYITAEAYTHTHSGRAARAGEVRCCAAALGYHVCEILMKFYLTMVHVCMYVELETTTAPGQPTLQMLIVVGCVCCVVVVELETTTAPGQPHLQMLIVSEGCLIGPGGVCRPVQTAGASSTCHPNRYGPRRPLRPPGARTGLTHPCPKRTIPRPCQELPRPPDAQLRRSPTKR